jgi:Mce-associated membrane protein
MPVKTDAVTEEAGSQASIEDLESADIPDTGGEEPPVLTPETVDGTEDVESREDEPKRKRRIAWMRVLAYGLLPGLALLLAAGAGYLKWQDSSVRDSNLARIGSIQAAKDSTTALLSYKPDTVEQTLAAARDLLTGEFRDSYTSLTKDVVIPGAKQKQILAVATVPAAASVSASPNRAVVLVFVNQSVIVGNDAPTNTASSVKVTLDKVGGRWLISGFDPV